MVDEETRNGSLFKEAVQGTVGIAGRLLGRSLLSHPYYVFHKPHMDVLAGAIDISSRHTEAQEAMRAAISGAENSARLSTEIGKLATRRKGLVFFYGFTLQHSLNSLAALPSGGESAAKKIADETGMNPLEFYAYCNKSLTEWREHWHELASDALAILIMVQTESRAVETLLARYHKIHADLSSEKPGVREDIGKIASAALDIERLILKSKHRDQKTAHIKTNPGEAAAKSLRLVDACADRTTRGATIALSDIVEANPAQAAQRLAAIENA